MTPTGDEQRTIEAEAAAWVVRLDAGPLDADECRAFEAWRRQSEAHDRAFRTAQRTWSELADLRAAQPSGLRPDRPVDRRHATSAPPVGTQPAVSRRWLGRGLAASIALMGGVGAFYATDPVTTLRADHSTGIGEVRTVALPDGSTAELNTDTAIAVAFTSNRRKVTLLQGEAAFTVAAGFDAPFVVRADGGTTEALGTQFVVRLASARAEVAVLRHRVAVAPPGEAAVTSRQVVKQGQAIGYTQSDGLGLVRDIDPEWTAAWRRGRLVFDDVPLAEAVAEINRYRRARVVVLDPGLAERRISGVFRIDDLNTAIEVIARETGARTTSIPPVVTALY